MAQSKLQLTKGDFFNVNSTHDRAVYDCQEIVLCLFPDKFINNHLM